MSEPTGYYDRHGIPIHVGDLIRVEHYRHRRGRRQMWVYFRVAIHPRYPDHAKYCVQNWNDLDASKWQCLLSDCGLDTAEVLAESGIERNDRGEVITFNERPRRKERDHGNESVWRK